MQEAQGSGNELDQALARSMPLNEHSSSVGERQDSRVQEAQGSGNELDQALARSMPLNEHSSSVEKKQDGGEQKMNYDQAEQIAKKRMREFELNQKDHKIVTNFTIFNETPFNKDGIEKVVTGMRYEKATDVHPNYQYCYASKPRANQHGEERYELAELKDGIEKDRLRDYYKWGLEFDYLWDSTVGSKSTLIEAQKLCAFKYQ